jgi:hypothetical protein
MSIELQKLMVHIFDLQSAHDSSTLVGLISFPCEESRMTTVELITALFYEVDEQRKRNKKVALKRRLRLLTVPPLDRALGASCA